MRHIAKSIPADSTNIDPTVPETDIKSISTPTPSNINKSKAKIPQPAWALTEEVAECKRIGGSKTKMISLPSPRT